MIKHETFVLTALFGFQPTNPTTLQQKLTNQMEKLTDNRTALSRFKSQNGFGILQARSGPSDYLKITQFKKDLKIREAWLISELSIIYGNKNAPGIFERFTDAIEKGNSVTVSIIDKCEQCGSILQEIVKRYETKNAALLKR